MAPAPIVLLLDGGGDEPGWTQPFAGGALWTECPLVAGATRTPRPARLPGVSGNAVWTTIYDGPGLVDGGLRMLRASLSAGGERKVEFEDGESFEISARGEVVHRSGPLPPDAHSLERALGAPLALALAIHGIYLLHASALGRRSPVGGDIESVIALTAPSGSGKSTLAAAATFASRRAGGVDAGESSWFRVADDILPVRLGPPAQALPHYPQLKLAENEGWAANAESSLPLTHLVEIEHSPARRAVEVERLPAAAACLAIARATVAAKLFDPELLAAHFSRCAVTAEQLAVHRLRFPSGLDRLPEVLDVLGDLGLLKP